VIDETFGFLSKLRTASQSHPPKTKAEISLFGIFQRGQSIKAS
jgi:hypothetical protein